MVGECKRAAVSKAESTPATSCVSQQTGGYSGVHEPKRWPETAATTVGCGGSIEEVYLQLIPSRCTKKQKQKQIKMGPFFAKNEKFTKKFFTVKC